LPHTDPFTTEVTMATATRRFDPQKIAKVRRERGHSQRSFARISGVPLETLRQYEQGRATPSVDRLITIADTLGCRVDDFTTEVEQ